MITKFKIFERLDDIKDLKKYFVNCVNDFYTLFEVKEIYYKGRFPEIKIRRLYHCDTAFDNELIKDKITDDIDGNFYLYKDKTVHTSDNLNECLDFIKLKLAANKYNL